MRLLRSFNRGEPKAMFIVFLAALLVLLSPFAIRYGHTQLGLLQFDAGGEASRGEPPFMSERDYQSARRGGPRSHTELKDAYKIAALDFPNAEACLADDARDLSRESLKRLDWDKLDNRAEAEVCIFRLLALGGSPEHAAEWLTAQGLTAHDAQVIAPWKLTGRREEIRVDGYWLGIRERGYKFFKPPLIFRLVFSPYRMTVVSRWSEEDRQLQYVHVSFDSK